MMVGGCRRFNGSVGVVGVCAVSSEVNGVAGSVGLLVRFQAMAIEVSGEVGSDVIEGSLKGLPSVVCAVV